MSFSSCREWRSVNPVVELVQNEAPTAENITATASLPEINSTTDAPQTTVIPPTEKGEQFPSRTGAVIYIAEEGETFASIAEQFGLDTFTLLIYNAGEDRLGLDLSNPILWVGDEV